MQTIIEMVNHTRLDCALGSAAGMRAGLVEAIHHAAHRSAFGKTLIEQPLMRNVLADLCVESEAATISAMRLARSYDDSIAGDEQAEAFKRIANPVLKYWICKREAPHVAECLECLGGNGYVEESGMPRLYRQAPLNSIWEGSGNVQCLDVLRTMVTRPRRTRRLLRGGRRGLERFEPRPLRLQAALRSGRDDRHRGAGARSRRAHGARPAGLALAALRRSSRC